MLVSVNKDKAIPKRYEELWEIKNQIYCRQSLPFKKTLELRNLIKDVRDGFHKDKKHYRKAFLDECFNKLETLYLHRTDVSEGQ